jgi:hypothetical protein
MTPFRRKCGAFGPRSRHEGPTLAPRTALTWYFSRADDGIRTRDPNLGKLFWCNSTTCGFAKTCSTMGHFD